MDSQTIALIVTAFASMIAAVTGAMTFAVALRASTMHAEIKTVATVTLDKVETLNREMNGMKTELIATTAQAAKAEGILEAKEEQRALDKAAGV